jgi:hypothetical protein
MALDFALEEDVDLDGEDEEEVDEDEEWSYRKTAFLKPKSFLRNLHEFRINVYLVGIRWFFAVRDALAAFKSIVEYFS